MGRRWSIPLDVLVGVNRDSTVPLREQVEDGIRTAIRDGRLAEGTRLPSSRSFAAVLGVARGVVVAAYEQLVVEGYLAAQQGSGTVVAVASRPSGWPSSAAPSGARPDPTRPRYDFRPGQPDLATFPRPAWLRATRTALAGLSDADLGCEDPLGLPGLRVALAGYLRRVRGVRADPASVIVTNGFAQGLSLVAAVLANGGHAAVATEDPGHPGPRRLLTRAGLAVRPVPVDDEGLQVGLLDSTVPAVLATPAHQFPTGVVLSAARRAQLVTWSGGHDGTVIEDDHDAEYRYDREPIGAVQGLAPDRVVYAGGVCKSLAPAVRLGWLVVPPSWIDKVMAGGALSDLGAAVLPQATLAELLTSGALERHLRRTRRHYGERREALCAALAEHAPWLRLTGAPAGLHAVVRLPSGLDEADVVRRAAAASVGVHPMSDYRVRSDASAPALVLGYAALSAAEIEAGILALAHVLRA